jgi:hypothetical protein
MGRRLSQGQQHRERERRHHGGTSIVDYEVLSLDPRVQALETYILEAYILQAYIGNATLPRIGRGAAPCGSIRQRRGGRENGVT